MVCRSFTQIKHFRILPGSCKYFTAKEQKNCYIVYIYSEGFGVRIIKNFVYIDHKTVLNSMLSFSHKLMVYLPMGFLILVGKPDLGFKK